MSFYFTHCALSIAFALGLGLTGATALTHAAGDDDYTRAIREEGNKLEFLNRAKEEIQQSEQKEKQASQSATAQPVQSFKDITDFEKALYKDAPASYSLYSKLPTDKRTVIYALYQKERKMSVVKRKIVDFYLSL
jgi:hypothetical protein